MSLKEKITLMVNSLNSQKKLVDYESIDALVKTLMEYYNGEIKNIKKDIEAGNITTETLNNKLDKGGVSIDYDTAKKIEDKIKQIRNDIDNGTVEVSWDNITGKPSTFPSATHSHAWDSITNKPSSFPPSAHNQSWSTITEKPSSFPPSSHTHNVIKDVGDNRDLRINYSANAPSDWDYVGVWKNSVLYSANKNIFLLTSGGTINGNLTVTGNETVNGNKNINGDLTGTSGKSIKGFGKVYNPVWG